MNKWEQILNTYGYKQFAYIWMSAVRSACADKYYRESLTAATTIKDERPRVNERI